MDDNYKIDEHWKVINSGGRQVSNTPEQLWEAAIDYFRWCDNNPITAKRTLTSGKTQGQKITIEHTRPYSIMGLCLHCSISERYLEDIKNTKNGSVWYDTVEKILYIIYTQNLEGAIVDLYNPMMVSKILNMDKKESFTDKPVQIEIVDSRSTTLANTENEVLQKLDYGKVEILKEKVENLKREN